MDEFSDPTPIATPEAFAKALLALRGSFSRSRPFSGSRELKLLKAHYAAPFHTVTTTQLAERLGLTNYSAANLEYGKLAHLVSDKLGYQPGPFADGHPHWWRTLAYGKDADASEDEGHYRWVMRPELCQALETIRWVKPIRTDHPDDDLFANANEMPLRVWGTVSNPQPTPPNEARRREVARRWPRPPEGRRPAASSGLHLPGAEPTVPRRPLGDRTKPRSFCQCGTHTPRFDVSLPAERHRRRLPTLSRLPIAHTARTHLSVPAVDRTPPTSTPKRRGPALRPREPTFFERFRPRPRISLTFLLGRGLCRGFPPENPRAAAFGPDLQPKRGGAGSTPPKKSHKSSPKRPTGPLCQRVQPPRPPARAFWSNGRDLDLRRRKKVGSRTRPAFGGHFQLKALPGRLRRPPRRQNTQPDGTGAASRHLGQVGGGERPAHGVLRPDFSLAEEFRLGQLSDSRSVAPRRGIR